MPVLLAIKNTEQVLAGTKVFKKLSTLKSLTTNVCYYKLELIWSIILTQLFQG